MAAPPHPEFPTQDQIEAYGDMVFLAMRSPHHRRMSVANLREALEPPVMRGQYHVFRFDDIPRGMITWARLGPEAERRLVSGDHLLHDDWTSGDHLWIIDFVAPYRGLTSGMVRWLMTPGNFVGGTFYFRRVTDGNRTRTIQKITIDPPNAVGMREADFL